MKILGLAIVAVVITALLFLTGLFSSSPAPLMMGFCAWTPAVFMLGWSVRSLLIGKRLALIRDDETSQPISSSNHQRRVERITRKEMM